MKRHAALIPLSHQHHDALALCVFIDRGLRDEQTVENVHKLRSQASDTFDLLISGHFDVEESVVFPAVKPYLPDQALIEELLSEHDSLRSKFKNLANHEDSELIAALKDLGDQLDRHIRTEERILFQTIQEVLDDSTLVTLGNEIAAEIRAVCLTSTLRAS
jgi:hemerythrin-like domain-containing protein